MPAIIRFITLLGAASALATANAAPVSSSTAVTCTRPITTTLCRDTPGEVNVKTPVGVARGLQSSSNSTRFAVRYASAGRWALPTKATEWATSGDDVNKLPPVCPQEYVDASAYSEDCLQLIIYTPPPKPLLNPSVPVLVWVHGGSFVVGSASGPGLDGEALARSTGAMVVVVQYRLGALGFIPPSSLNSNSNLGVRDVITALEFTRQVVPTFGGNINQVTVAGQSSGGQMIRALLASPSASSLFKYAAIHSDPMDYGFYKPETITKQQNYLYTQTSGALAACNNAIDCQKKVPLAQLLKAQSEMLNMSPALDPATAGGSPVRPHHDGQLLQYTLTGDSFPPASGLKPVLVLTVKDEAASTVGGNNFFPDPVPAFYFAPTITTYFNDTEDRGTKLVSSSNYDPSEYSSQAGVAKDDEARAAFTQLFTDGYWRCPSWTFSRTWASKGVSAYVGEFQIGATYPSNSDIDYCKTGGRVCHEDDIYILFGTTPSPTSAQTALTKEIQARYSNFIRSGNPNPSAGGYANWSPSGTTDVKAIKLGGTGNRAAEACDPSFWGKAIPYDYQLYGL